MDNYKIISDIGAKAAIARASFSGQNILVDTQ